MYIAVLPDGHKVPIEEWAVEAYFTGRLNDRHLLEVLDSATTVYDYTTNTVVYRDGDSRPQRKSEGKVIVATAVILPPQVMKVKATAGSNHQSILLIETANFEGKSREQVLNLLSLSFQLLYGISKADQVQVEVIDGKQ